MSLELSWSWMGLIILRCNIPNGTTQGWLCPWSFTKAFVKPNNKHVTIKKNWNLLKVEFYAINNHKQILLPSWKVYVNAIMWIGNGDWKENKFHLQNLKHCYSFLFIVYICLMKHTCPNFSMPTNSLEF
jgi:hypothetical protein